MQRDNTPLTPLFGALSLVLLAGCGGGGSAPAGGGEQAGGGGGGGFGEGSAPTTGALFERENAFGGSDLYAVPLDGSDEPLRLTQHTTDDVGEVFSPPVDGSVLYETFDGSDRRYRRVTLDGSAPAETLIGAGEADFIGNIELFGDQLVYSRSGSPGRMMSVDVATGVTRTLAELPEGSFFFTGTYITESRHMLFTHTPEGSDVQTVYAVDLTEETPAFAISTPGVSSSVQFDFVRNQDAIYGNTVVMLERASSGGRQMTANDPTAPALQPLLELPSTQFSLISWTVISDYLVAVRRDSSFITDVFAANLTSGPIRRLSNSTQTSTVQIVRDLIGTNGIAFTTTRYSGGDLVEARVETCALDDPTSRTEVTNNNLFPLDPNTSTAFGGVSVVGEALVIQRTGRNNDVTYATYGSAASEALLAPAIDLPYRLGFYAGNSNFGTSGLMGGSAVDFEGSVLLAVRPNVNTGDALNLWSVRPGQPAIPLSDVATNSVGSVGTIHTFKNGRVAYSRGVLHYATTLGQTLSEVRITNNGFPIEPASAFDIDTDEEHALFFAEGQLLAARLDGSTDLIALTSSFGDNNDERRIEELISISPDQIVLEASEPNSGPQGVYTTALDDDPTTMETRLSTSFDADDDVRLLF